MATASDLLFGLESEYSICVTVGGDTYVDRYPEGGGDVLDRLTGGLIYTQSISSVPFGSSATSTLASIQAANTSLAPLTSQFASSFKGEPYTVYVCGVIDKGLITEQIITFDNKVEYISGTCKGVSFSDSDFLFSFSGNDKAYSRLILDEIEQTGDQVLASEFDFEIISATNSRDTGAIQTDVTPSTLTSGSQTIDITFDNTITDLDITLEKAGGAEPLKSFTYSDVSSTKVSSTGQIVSDITLSSTTDLVTTVTLDFTPADSMKWVIRDIDVESISNWSIAPDSVSPAYGNAVNSVHTWTNLAGANQITFDLTKSSATAAPISIPLGDPQTRPHIFGGSTSVKIWPLEIVESIPLPASVSWTETPTSAPSSGVLGSYVWTDDSFSTLDLSATFSGVSGSAPLVLTSENNKVTLSNGLIGLRLAFNRVYKSPSGDPSKVGFNPLGVGRPINNYAPLWLGGQDYDFGCTQTFQARDNGTVIFPVFSQVDFDTQDGLGNVVFYRPNALENLVKISGSPTEITVTGWSADRYLVGAVKELASKAGISGSNVLVDSSLLLFECSDYITEQKSLKQALDDLLSPLDCVHYFRLGNLIVEPRKSFSVTNFDVELERDFLSELKVGIENDRVHKLTVFYSKNWNVQESLAEYKSEYKKLEKSDDSVKYSDHPTNTVLSGSIDRIVYSKASYAGGAAILADTLDRDSRENRPVSFIYDCRGGEILPNTRIKIPDGILTGGMFLPHKIQINTDRRTQYVEGTWYGE